MKILGTGSALPKKVVTNDDLTAFLDTNDEWIATRTGIRQRRVLSDETLQTLAEQAGSRALENAGVSPDEIDFVLVSTVQAETMSPALACDIQPALGLKCMGLDINGGCTGFIAAMAVAEGLIASGRAGKVLVISAEALSRFADWTDRSTCVLFGDAAGAAVLSEGDGVVDIRFTSEPRREVLCASTPPGNSPFAIDPAPAQYLKMAGQEVYKFAVSHSSRDIREMLAAHGLDPAEVDYYVLHQANMRILEAVRARLGVSAEHFPHNIERTGNTSSATIPVLLDEMNRESVLKPGCKVILSAFGAGLCTGTALIRWQP
ncbi:MAG: ketoacyl-ACP synthase III [Clostridia bacterium]|nr:ketoacyl-ACP synthase III [Clostridia bacterium]